MKKTILKTLLIFTLLNLYNCNNDDNEPGFTPTLPAITQTGENTFGCYIDGKLLTPRDGSGGIYGTPKGMSLWALGSPPNYSWDEIRIQDYKGGTGGIVKIHITDLHQNGEGTFTIEESNCEDGIDANPTINIHCRTIDETSQTYKWYRKRSTSNF